MSEAEPDPASCRNNLHRHPDLDGQPVEATELCRSPLGPIHMLDCPLFLGRHCTYYDPVQEPVGHVAASDADIDATAAALRVDFLRWPYRDRVRALAIPADALPVRIPVEAIPDAEEEAGADVDFAAMSVAAVARTEAEPPPEMYPGQRRSEDRRKRRREERAKEAEAQAAHGDACGGGAHGDPDSGAVASDSEAAAASPRTVADLLDAMPGAEVTEEDLRRRRIADGERDEGGGRKDSGRGGRRRGRRGAKAEGAAPEGRPRRRRGSDARGSDARGGGTGSTPSRSAASGEPSASKPEGTPGDGTPRRRRRRRKPDAGGKPDAGAKPQPEQGAARTASSGDSAEAGTRRRPRRRRRGKSGGTAGGSSGGSSGGPSGGASEEA